MVLITIVFTALFRSAVTADEERALRFQIKAGVRLRRLRCAGLLVCLIQRNGSSVKKIKQIVVLRV